MLQKKILYVVLLSLSLLCFLGCGEEHTPQHVKVVIRTNTPGTPVKIESRKGLIIKDYWETAKVLNFGESIEMRATCDDPNTLLTGEVYVDGRLHYRKEENEYLRIGYTYR